MSEIKKIKPALSKGTRDFLPVEVAKRNYIFDTIKNVFRKYGFEEIETPAIERLETLTGKYGDEGDKLLFKILNSGDFLKDVPKEDLSAANSLAVLKHIAEKGLRYDLTVPLARYVVQHQESLAFPFKRFHIGPVWRADRPQKGRYQEFYQCDADVIGSESLLNEVELTMIYAEVFKKLGVPVIIQINSRKFLRGLADHLGIIDNLSEFTTILDKEDKIGPIGVREELNKHPLFSATNIGDKYFEVVKDQSQYGADVSTLVTYFKNLFQIANSAEGIAGLQEIERVLSLSLSEISEPNRLVFTFSLARGLSYYSGIIWEVVLNKFPALAWGSLGGGGRYDNLTEMFGAKNMSGVGISFGIERIYDVMEELNLFPPTISQGVKVLFVPREKEMEGFAFQQAQVLRNAGIGAEVYLGNVKKQKHFKYIEDKQIAYLVEVGSDEMTSGKFRLRVINTRMTQENLSIQDIVAIMLQ